MIGSGADMPNPGNLLVAMGLGFASGSVAKPLDLERLAVAHSSKWSRHFRDIDAETGHALVQVPCCNVAFIDQDFL